MAAGDVVEHPPAARIARLKSAVRFVRTGRLERARGAETWTGDRAHGVTADQRILGKAEPRATTIGSTHFTMALALDIRALKPHRRAGCSRGQRCARRGAACSQHGRASRVVFLQNLEMPRRARVQPVAFDARVVAVLALHREIAMVSHGGFGGRARLRASIRIGAGVQRVSHHVRRGIHGCAGVADERAVQPVHRGPSASASGQGDERHQAVPLAHARTQWSRSAFGVVAAPWAFAPDSDGAGGTYVA
jgi:hypothetical protein